MTKSLFIVLTLTVFFAGFTPERNQSVINYDNLSLLQRSSAPSWVRVIRVANIGNNKSVDTQGILFTYKNRRARKVEIAGSFCDWKTIPMIRGNNAVWFYLLDENIPVENLSYKFRIDGIWTMDPQNPSIEDDGIGSSISILKNIPSKDENPRQTTSRVLPGKTVEFRIYRPSARMISVAGDFNRWNPENDLLERGKSGVWHLKRRLPSGSYRYRFVVDGDNTLDIYNENSSSDAAGEICSIITIK